MIGEQVKRASEASETLSGLFNQESRYIAIRVSKEGVP